MHRAGYDVWNWQDKAILQAVKWLTNEFDYPAEGDDTWQVHIINYYYGTDYPAPIPSGAGKNVGFTDWTHGSNAKGNSAMSPPEGVFYGNLDIPDKRQKKNFVFS